MPCEHTMHPQGKNKLSLQHLKVNNPFYSLKLFSTETILIGAGLYCCWLPVCCSLHYFGWPSFTLLWLALLEPLGADLPSNTFLWVPEDSNSLLQFTGKDSVEKIIKLAALRSKCCAFTSPSEMWGWANPGKNKASLPWFCNVEAPMHIASVEMKNRVSPTKYENVLLKEKGVTSWQIPEKLHPRTASFSPVTIKTPTG